MLERCRVSYNSVLINGLFLDGKMIGVTTAYLMKEYLTMQLKSKSELYTKLGEIGRQL